MYRNESIILNKDLTNILPAEMIDVEIAAGTMQPIKNNVITQNFIFKFGDENNTLFSIFVAFTVVALSFGGSRVIFQLTAVLANRCLLYCEEIAPWY